MKNLDFHRSSALTTLREQAESVVRTTRELVAAGSLSAAYAEDIIEACAKLRAGLNEAGFEAIRLDNEAARAEYHARRAAEEEVDIY